MTYLIIIALAFIIPLTLFLTLGPEHFWHLCGIELDLGRTDFKSLAPSDLRNAALACPKDFCPQVAGQIKAPQFPVTVETLRTEFRKSLGDEVGLVRVHVNDAAFRERYVQRSPLLKLPSTIQVEFIDLGYGKSSLALYSRTNPGYDLLGNNKRRLGRWLENLEQQAASNQARTFQRRSNIQTGKVAAE